MANPDWTDPSDWEDKFGVFILRDGEWVEHTTGTEGYARRECEYLRNCGVDAQVFVRVSA